MSRVTSAEYTLGVVVDALERAPDTAQPERRIFQNLDAPQREVSRAVDRLVKLGELTVTEVGPGGRHVRLNRSVDRDRPSPPDVADTAWLAYVAVGVRERRSSRLFAARRAALDHLCAGTRWTRQSFRRVPSLDGVWVAETGGVDDYGGELAVVRHEPVHDPRRAP